MSVKLVNIFVCLLKDFYQTPGVPGVPEYLSEVVKAPECLSSLEIFLYDFYKTPGVPGVPEYFSEVVEALECLSSL